MKLLTFDHPKDGRNHLGVLMPDGEHVLVLLTAAAAAGGGPTDAFASMLSYLEAGPEAAVRAATLLANAEVAPESPTVVKLSRLRLRPPVYFPRKVLALAGNYREHIMERGGKLAPQDLETPRVFMKPPTTTIIGPGDPIRLPPFTRAVDWEGELAVIIGRRCKAVPAAEALACVAGYTIMNDVSERKFKIRERSSDRERDKWFDWLSGKWLDSFAPLGPWLVTADEVPDPQALTIRTYVNGEERQSQSTADMIFPVAELIAYISTYVTLEPGDVISTGTVAGVGAATDEYLTPGAQVAVTIDGLGRLENPVVAADA